LPERVDVLTVEPPATDPRLARNRLVINTGPPENVRADGRGMATFRASEEIPKCDKVASIAVLTADDEISLSQRLRQHPVWCLAQRHHPIMTWSVRAGKTIKEIAGQECRAGCACDVDKTCWTRRGQRREAHPRSPPPYRLPETLVEVHRRRLHRYAQPHILMTIDACRAADVYVEKPCTHNIFEAGDWPRARTRMATG
jgi:hypothetical protein